MPSARLCLAHMAESAKLVELLAEVELLELFAHAGTGFDVGGPGAAHVRVNVDAVVDA